jgi:hypothetical protein
MQGNKRNWYQGDLQKKATNIDNLNTIIELDLSPSEQKWRRKKMTKKSKHYYPKIKIICKWTTKDFIACVRAHSFFI